MTTHTNTTSFNGTIVSLSSIEEATNKSNIVSSAVIPHALARIPYVRLLKVYNMSKELFYLPSEWSEYRSTLLALIRAAHNSDIYFRNSEVFISVLPKTEAVTLVEGNHLVITAHSVSPKSLADEELHETHNFVLSWFTPEEPEPITGSLNLML